MTFQFYVLRPSTSVIAGLLEICRAQRKRPSDQYPQSRKRRDRNYKKEFTCLPRDSGSNSIQLFVVSFARARNDTLILFCAVFSFSRSLRTAQNLKSSAKGTINQYRNPVKSWWRNYEMRLYEVKSLSALLFIMLEARITVKITVKVMLKNI